RRPAAQIEFTREEMTRWLWKNVGLHAVLCPYCHRPIDILSLTLDHVVPRSIGGRFCLDNMEAICQACNEQKGQMSAPGFMGLLRFLRDSMSQYDQGVLLKRLKDANAGSRNRFFRDKKPQPQMRSTPAPAAGDF